MRTARAGHRPLRRARISFRRGLRWAEMQVPRLRRELSSWGGSLAFHGAILLFLLWVVLHSAPVAEEEPIDTAIQGQLTDDVTSAADANEAGDPFTKLDDDAISLPMDPDDLDPSILNVPELPESIRFSDEMASGAVLDLGTRQTNAPSVMEPTLGSSPAMLGAVSMTAPFSGRSPAAKAALLRKEGGTKESEAAVERGLDWIARHQAEDGHWSLDPTPFCGAVPCGPANAMVSDTAATGLALLPMLGAGHIHTQKGRYQGTIARGLAWLLAVQSAEGELHLGGEWNSQMYSHAIATMALCEAYGLSGDQKLRRPAQAGVDFICRAQNSLDGGWRYYPGQSGDTSVFGWQMMCLRSAFLSGLKVPGRSVTAARTYLRFASVDKRGTAYSYLPGRTASPVMTAEALLCRQYLGWSRDMPAMKAGAGMVFEDLMNSSENNIYYWYYATQMLHNMGGKAWPVWNDRVRDYLVMTQIKTPTCDHGSWEPGGDRPDRWGRSAGRHFVTCLSLLTLEVYYRYLPLYREKDSRPLEGERQPAPPAEKAAQGTN